MQQRVELSSIQNCPAIETGCTDLILAVTDEATHASLVLPASLTRIQITGKGSLDGLTLSGDGQIVRLVASNPRSIRELQIDCLVLEVVNLTVSRLHLLDEMRGILAPGVCFIDAPRPVLLSRVSARERVVVRHENLGKSLGVFIDRGSNASSDSAAPQGDGDPDAEVVHLKVKELRVPDLAVAAGVRLTLEEWAPGVKEYPVVVLARQARLRLAGKTSIGPMMMEAPEGSLELVSAIAEGVSGVLGCLATSGPCVLRGEGLQLSRLRCDTGADISGLVVHSLDLASLSHAALASAFDVILPGDRSWHGFQASTTYSTWWREPAAWRTLYQQLERKGRPATAAWARRMEREARRTLASRSSMEYAVLGTAHLLGYGESVLRPLLAQGFVTILALTLIIVTTAHPGAHEARNFALLIPRLYLAPVGLLRSGYFAPGVGASIFDTIAWIGATLSGAVCFGTAALAVRRLLAYS